MSNTRSIRMDWEGEGLRFRGGATDSNAPHFVLDGNAEQGPTPMDALLLACAGCAGADVVSILQKMKVDLGACSIEIVGTRRAEHPKRYTAVKYLFRISGKGLERTKAERAVTLSLTKFCSAVLTLNPDIRVEHEIELL